MVGLLGGSIVGAHNWACLLVGHLQHRRGTSAGRILPGKVDHLAGHMDQDDHFRLLAVQATSLRHPIVIHQWGCLALSCHVGNGRMLVGKLLLLGVMVGWHSVAACQGQDCLVHACC